MLTMTGFERDAIIANNVILFLAGREEYKPLVNWMKENMDVRRLRSGELLVSAGKWMESKEGMVKNWFEFKVYRVTIKINNTGVKHSAINDGA